MKFIMSAAMAIAATTATAGQKSVFLESADGARIEIAQLSLEPGGTYQVVMDDTAFSDHFLSMRPFKCLEGANKHWCHVPYPYPIRRDIAADFTDLEYDFLFVWKGASDYGINMWNGVYYKIEEVGGQLIGALHEMDMDRLSAPPEEGNLRPLQNKDLHESDPDSHWLPRLVID